MYSPLFLHFVLFQPSSKLASIYFFPLNILLQAYLTFPLVLPLQQLISQQKDGDVEEKQKMAAEKEAQQKRINQLTEELAKLKTEVARWESRAHNIHLMRFDHKLH